MNRWNGYYNMHTHRAYTYVQRNNAKLVHFGLRMMSQEVFFFFPGTVHTQCFIIFSQEVPLFLFKHQF